MVLLALERGHLDRITSPIHRYLIDGGSLRPNVRHQYLKDLRERWMHCVDPIERHRKSRIFHSRLAELQCAEWLEAQGWVIEGLEALREGPDIEAASAEGAAAAFEVKLIGTEDVDFEMILRNIAGEAAGGPVSAYSGINYLLFRVYEAAKQLAGINSRRIAVVIVEDLTWWRFELQLKNRWIDWSSPKFVGQDSAWEAFLKELQGRYPDLMSEMPSVVRGLDAVWIVRQSEGYRFRLEYEVAIRSA